MTLETVRAVQLRLIVSQNLDTGQIWRRWWHVPTTFERRQIEEENARFDASWVGRIPAP